VRDLSQALHTRVEMRQVVRDLAGSVVAESPAMTALFSLVADPETLTNLDGAVQGLPYQCVNSPGGDPDEPGGGSVGPPVPPVPPGTKP
jgi:hypothetical protein